MNWKNMWEAFIDTMSKPYYQNLVLKGLGNTVMVAVLGLIIGIVIGTLIAIVKVAPKYKLIMRILDKICSVYVAIFRGTPMVVQLLITYYVLLPAFGAKGVDALIVGVAVFGMNSGAYVSEIMRGGLNSIDHGQMEAGRALGLSYSTTMMKIVIPQAIKNILPMIGNEFISIIKETSILSFITVCDIYTALINYVAANKYEWIIPYIALALIYIVLVLGITLLIKLMEKALAKSDKSNGYSRKKVRANKELF